MLSWTLASVGIFGHGTIAVTLDTYSRVLPTMQEIAAMEDALT
jgi:hypothetical protein